MSSCHVCVCIMAPSRPLHHLLDVNIPSLCQRSATLPYCLLTLHTTYLSRYQDNSCIQHQNWVKMVIQWKHTSASANAIFQYILLLVLMIVSGKTVTNEPGIELMANIRSNDITTTYGAGPTFTSTVPGRCDFPILSWVWMSNGAMCNFVNLLCTVKCIQHPIKYDSVQVTLCAMLFCAVLCRAVQFEWAYDAAEHLIIWFQCTGSVVVEWILLYGIIDWSVGQEGTSYHHQCPPYPITNRVTTHYTLIFLCFTTNTVPVFSYDNMS